MDSLFSERERKLLSIALDDSWPEGKLPLSGQEKTDAALKEAGEVSDRARQAEQELAALKARLAQLEDC